MARYTSATAVARRARAGESGSGVGRGSGADARGARAGESGSGVGRGSGADARGARGLGRAAAAARGRGLGRGLRHAAVVSCGGAGEEEASAARGQPDGVVCRAAASPPVCLGLWLEPGRGVAIYTQTPLVPVGATSRD